METRSLNKPSADLGALISLLAYLAPLSPQQLAAPALAARQNDMLKADQFRRPLRHVSTAQHLHGTPSRQH